MGGVGGVWGVEVGECFGEVQEGFFSPFRMTRMGADGALAQIERFHQPRSEYAPFVNVAADAHGFDGYPPVVMSSAATH